MKRISLLVTVTFALFLAGTAMGSNVAMDIKSAPTFPAVQKTSPTPQIDQYDYDLALTNIGIHNPPDDCIEYCETWTMWVKAYNNGYEVVDCAEIIFTINGVEVGRVHVAGLMPGETRKYTFDFHVDWEQCEPFVIDAHVDWPLDENPDNNDIEDDFAVAGEPDTVLIHDDGTVANAWTWVPGYEYPDNASAAKYTFDMGGVIKYWEFYYANTASYPAGHLELFVWAADPTTGEPIDDGTGGLYDMEFQYDRVDWPSYAYICYPICHPVEPGEAYFFGYCNRQGNIAFFCIDAMEDNPDWNWYKTGGTWYSGNLYDGDFWVHVGLELAGVMMSCEALTPVFCRGKDFYFVNTITNNTGGSVTGTMSFTGYAGYDCDPLNTLVTINRTKTYPDGETTTYYFFKVPNAAGPGQYSASVSGTLAGYDLFCCMNVDIIECSPWRIGDNTEWELVEVDRPEVLPSVTSLAQNYPNPFNATTKIAYNLGEEGLAKLEIYNLSGQKVKRLVNHHQSAGEHQVTWDGKDESGNELSGGIYFYLLVSPDQVLKRRMILLK